MVRRGSVDYLNRLYAGLTYLLPMTAVVMFGAFLFLQLPPLAVIFSPIVTLNAVLSISILDFISVRLVVWFCLFIFVVRSYKVHHFVRFNGLQALLLDVVVALVSAIVQILSIVLGQFDFFPFVLQIIASVTFLGVMAASIYATSQCVVGRYADRIPVISEVTYYQVR